MFERIVVPETSGWVRQRKRRRAFGYARRTRVPYKRAETLYQTMGVLPTATKDEIQRSRRFLLRRTHPDKNKTKLARIHWECLDKTCDILLCDTDRRKYDYLLRKRLLPPHGDVCTDFARLRQILDETL